MAAAANVECETAASLSWALKVKVGKKQEPQTDILTLPAPAQRWILEAKGDPTDIFHHQIISHQEEVTSKVADKGSSACICPGLNVSGRKKLVCARVRVCVCVFLHTCVHGDRKRERVGGSEGGVWAVTNSSEWVRINPSCLIEKQWDGEKKKKIKKALKKVDATKSVGFSLKWNQARFTPFK